MISNFDNYRGFQEVKYVRTDKYNHEDDQDPRT